MRRFLVATTAALLLMGAGAPFPTVIDLPNPDAAPTGLGPEGIASGHGNDFYVGSLTTGAIVKGDYRTGETDFLVASPVIPVAVGLAFDASSEFLWVAGGPTGQIAAYDTTTGEAVANITVGSGFINDVIVHGGSVFATNSFAPVIYRVDADGTGGVETIQLSGPAADFVQGFNINGIEATDGALIIVNSSKGEIYTVDPEDGSSAIIELGGEFVFTADGILLNGSTLYVLQNGGAPGVDNQIVVIKLDDGLGSGTVVNAISDDGFDTATTVAKKGSSLAVVNAVDFGATTFNDYRVIVVDRN